MFEIEEAMRDYNEKLLRYATAILCNYHDAEDIVQQVFLQAYANSGAFDGKNLNAWLYKITFNKCLDFKKKRTFYLFGDMRITWEKGEEPENPFEHEESDEALEILRLLNPEDRALLYGRIFEEKSYEELSEIFNKPPQVLRKRYERAKSKLAKKLETERGKINVRA